MKKIICLSAFSIALLVISSCQKEINKPGDNSLQQTQKVSNGAAVLKTTATVYAKSSKKNYEAVVNKEKILKENIKKLTLDRNQYQNKQAALSTTISEKKSVIHVPGDYSTIQAAVDNSIDGGKIIIDGTVLQSGNVMLDVPNLTIQGEREDDQESSAIKDNSNAGDNVVITVPGVTIKNLKLLNIGIVTNNANGETLINLNAINSNPDVFTVIGLFGSNNNIVKNCTISYSVLGVNNVSGIGIFLDDFSNINTIDSCKVFNTQFTAFGIEGSNNLIKNCGAFNFYRGFISFDGVSTGNVFKDCVANHSYADAGFVFLNFNTNNTTVTLENCTANDNVAFASIVNYGGSVVISNCTASLNTRNIAGNNPNGIFVGGVGQSGEFAKISNCTTNSNAFGGIAIFDMNFLVTNNTCNKNLGDVPGSGMLAIFSTNGLPMSGTLKGNTTDFNLNNAIGILLNGITNSTIIKNESMHNSVCDFDQTNCSGNTLTSNQFGSICTGL
jgi:hypothetical protein